MLQKSGKPSRAFCLTNIYYFLCISQSAVSRGVCLHFSQTFLKLLMHSLSRKVCSCNTKREIFGEFWRGQTIIIFSNFCKLQAQNLKIFAKLYRLLKVGYCPSTSRVPVIPLSPVVLIPPPLASTPWLLDGHLVLLESRLCWLNFPQSQKKLLGYCFSDFPFLLDLLHY